MDRTARRFLVTGGAGFIGSAVVRHLIRETKHEVVVFDKLTYAGNLASLAPVSNDPRYRFVTGDITDAAAVRRLFEAARPDVVLNLAAESHVDRSINGAAAFVQTNIVGTYVLLEAARAYLSTLPRDRQPEFRFLHISTDEVFGSLGETGRFSEATPYQPNSPYSASKASSDHLVRAWHHTYGLPVLLTNCSNNYGPYQFPEKLIPLIVLNCLEGKELPVYGQGENVRDWLFVDDHVRALLLVAAEGRVGESYNVGGDSEVRNIDVVQAICDIVDRLAPDREIPRRASLIRYVTDRPGHDLRYAIDATKIGSELGWIPQTSFASGLERTVRWYLENRAWWEPLRTEVYAGRRLGLVS